jgi:hypothetical protein
VIPVAIFHRDAVAEIALDVVVPDDERARGQRRDGQHADAVPRLIPLWEVLGEEIVLDESAARVLVEDPVAVEVRAIVGDQVPGPGSEDANAGPIVLRDVVVKNEVVARAHEQVDPAAARRNAVREDRVVMDQVAVRVVEPDPVVRARASRDHVADLVAVRSRQEVNVLVEPCDREVADEHVGHVRELDPVVASRRCQTEQPVEDDLVAVAASDQFDPVLRGRCDHDLLGIGAAADEDSRVGIRREDGSLNACEIGVWTVGSVVVDDECVIRKSVRRKQQPQRDCAHKAQDSPHLLSPFLQQGRDGPSRA